MRRICCYFGLLSVTLACVAGAQERAGMQESSALLRTDPDLDALMDQARKLTETRQYATAIEIYQGVIEKAGDRVVAVAGAGDKVFVIAAEAARRALLKGPEALRTEYASRYEPQAKQAVMAALAVGDLAALRRLSGQFPATASAQDARWWCGALLADAGESAAASAAWDEFVSLQPTLGGGQDLALTLTQLAVAQARAGLTEPARATLSRLKRDFGQTRRVIGSVEQDVVEFARQKLGEAGRAVQAVEIPRLFAPTPRWVVPIQDALSGQVAVAGRCALVRSASEMTCVDLTAGKRLWQTRAPLQAAADSVEALRVSIAGRGDRGIMDVARHAPQVAAGVVYTVENSPGYGRQMELGFMPGVGPRRSVTSKFGNSSQLIARDIETGKTIWRVGRGEGNDDFIRAARWVSAPTIVNGRLYVIALHVQSYHVVCLDATNGRLVWRTFICQRPEMGPSWSGAADLDRCSPPCVSLGRVLCLTNAGMLACFDQLTGEPSWFRAYGTVSTDSRAALIRAVTARSGMVVNPICSADGMAVMTPADSEELMAVDVVTGRLCWTASRDGRQQLVGLVPGDAASGATTRVIMASPGAAALNLADGKPVWNLPLDGVSGRPLLHGTRLCVLSRNRGIIQLDARNGRELACSPIGIGESQNLALGGTTVLMTASRTLTALADFREALDELTQRITANPDDVRHLRGRGELNLRVGRLKEALDDLTRARSRADLTQAGDPATDALLFRCHLELAAREPAQALALLEKAALYAGTPAMRSERWLRLGETHAARKSWSAACDAWQMVLDNETETWLDQPETRADAGKWLVGGRVSNRALAASSIEKLVREQGASIYASAESAAAQLLAGALARDDTMGLVELTRRYPVGETQERAWLALAERAFSAKQHDQAADTLSQFLRAQPEARHKADAALGLALAGIRGDRLGLARRGLALLEAAGSNTRAQFADVGATAEELGRMLPREATAAGGVEPVARPAASRGTRTEIPTTAVGGVFSGQLFYERGQVTRVDRGEHVLWMSVPLIDGRRSSVGNAAGVLFVDTLVVMLDRQVAALDATTGKLLWEQRGINLAGRSTVTAIQGAQIIVGGGGRVVIGGRGGGGLFIAEGGSQQSSSSIMLADEQLLSIVGPGVVVSLSPRRGEPIWSVELPDTKANWANASTRIEGRHLALVVPETSTQAGSRVVVIDLHRGRLQAIWNLPPNTPQFTILEDGRVQAAQ